MTDALEAGRLPSMFLSWQRTIALGVVLHSCAPSNARPIGSDNVLFPATAVTTTDTMESEPAEPEEPGALLRCNVARKKCAPDKLTGMSEADIQARYGTPRMRTGGRWIYVLPESCSERKDELTVTFDCGRVVRAEARQIVTGQHCE